MEPASKTYSVSGPKGLPFVGALPNLWWDRLGFALHNAQRYGDIIPYDVLGQRIIQINHPDLVRYLLMENYSNYQKSRRYARFESVLGKGLLTSTGEKWQRDRQALQPMFNREHVEGHYFDIMNTVSENFKHRWLTLTEKGAVHLCIHDEMSAYTTEIILRIIFGHESVDETAIASLREHYGVMIRYLKEARLIDRIDLRKQFKTPGYRRFAHALQETESLVQTLAGRYQQHANNTDHTLMALLMQASQRDPAHFTAGDIRDHLVSMVFAGFESTAVLLQWIWYVLDEHPEVADAARRELQSHLPSADANTLTLNTLGSLEYVFAVVKETMRLYPPFWMIGREAVAADQLGDFRVRPGDTVVAPTFAMHRHPSFWPEPESFNPERFLHGNEARIDPGTYFPFSLGPRKCSGYRIVELEMKTLLAKLLPLFHVKILNRKGNPIDVGITIQPKHALQAEISRL